MKNNEYLNEEKYQKVKKVLIRIGLISVTIGIILFIASFFIKDINSDTSTTIGVMRFAAFVFGIFVPIGTFCAAFGREINAFNAQQSIPIVQEGMEKVTPAMKNTSREIAKGIKEGFTENNDIYCKHCGASIDYDSKFCKSCGKEQ